MKKFSDAEIAGLVKHGFTVNNGMAELTGDLTITVLSGRRPDGLVQMIINGPNSTEIFCAAAPGEIFDN